MTRYQKLSLASVPAFLILAAVFALPIVFGPMENLPPAIAEIVSGLIVAATLTMFGVFFLTARSVSRGDKEDEREQQILTKAMAVGFIILSVGIGVLSALLSAESTLNVKAALMALLFFSLGLVGIVTAVLARGGNRFG